MQNHHLKPHQKNFFEGWYFKQSNGRENIAFIPGVNIDESGHQQCFIQVITNNRTINIDYDYSQFYADKNSLYIKVGNSIFSPMGLWLDIEYQGAVIKGELRYSKLTPIKYDIMGPFSLLPFMECNHGILSMDHRVAGTINYCGQDIEFSSGACRGYIEKDWGHSFPKAYTWVQCNTFQKDQGSFMASIATVPIGVFGFTGHIGVAAVGGREYRFATYNAGRAKLNGQDTIVLKKNNLRLQINIRKKEAKPLKAPANGTMARTIHESMCCEAEFMLTKGNKVLFHDTGENVCFENTYKN